VLLALIATASLGLLVNAFVSIARAL
jgi:hypothetical protein